MKFAIKHLSEDKYLRKPRFIGDTVHWTEPLPAPVSARQPWLFSTRDGATKARDMHALKASVVVWYETGDTAQRLEQPAFTGTSSNADPVVLPPVAVMPDVHVARPCNNGMQDYILAAALADLCIVSSEFGGC